MSFFNTDHPERWHKCLKLSAVFIVGAFFFGLIVGTLGGIADPDGGWSAWRVGLLVGVIFGSAAVVFSFIASAIHIGDL